MYTVRRKEGKVFVVNVDQEVVYASEDSGYIVYKAGGHTMVNKVSQMNDEQLLMALASVIEIGPSKGD